MSFDEKSSKRIAEAVRWVERQIKSSLPNSPYPALYDFIVVTPPLELIEDDEEKKWAWAEIYERGTGDRVLSADSGSPGESLFELWFTDDALWGRDDGYKGVCSIQDGKYWALEKQTGFPFKNVSGETIESFGVMQLTGDYDADRLIPEADLVNTDGCSHPGLIIINGEDSVPEDSYGSATVSRTFYVRANNDDDEDNILQIGDEIGPVNESQYMGKRGKGFVIKMILTDNVVLAECNSNVLEVVKVNGPKDDATGLYPGEVQRYDPVGSSWVKLFECKVKDSNDA